MKEEGRQPLIMDQQHWLTKKRNPNNIESLAKSQSKTKKKDIQIITGEREHANNRLNLQLETKEKGCQSL